jgi:fructokinase
VNPGPTIVGLGEALFDIFPEHQVVGGAPLNVAVHAQQMLAALGGQGIPASRIGRDELGRRLLAELEPRAIPTSALQVDDQRPTGRVLVTLNGREPNYEIVADVAWDALEFTNDWGRLAARCAAVCFGTLAQRSSTSRETIARFLAAAPRAIRMFDVNLRQDFYTADLLRESAHRASVVKLNEQELPVVDRLLGIAAADADATPDRQAEALREHFGLDAVVLTRGAAGTSLYTAAGKTEGEPPRYPPAPGADSVGAGDACSAGILVGMLLKWPPARTVALANSAGAYVASQPGATPELPHDLLDTELRR